MITPQYLSFRLLRGSGRGIKYKIKKANGKNIKRSLRKNWAGMDVFGMHSISEDDPCRSIATMLDNENVSVV